MILSPVTFPWLSRSVILPKISLKGLILIIKSTYQGFKVDSDPWFTTNRERDTRFHLLQNDTVENIIDCKTRRVTRFLNRFLVHVTNSLSYRGTKVYHRVEDTSVIDPALACVSKSGPRDIGIGFLQSVCTVPIFSFVFQAGGRVSSHFRQGETGAHLVFNFKPTHHWYTPNTFLGSDALVTMGESKLNFLGL